MTPTEKREAIRKDLYEVLSKYVPTWRYLTAHNNATLIHIRNEEDETLGDLTGAKERAMEALNAFVEKVVGLEDRVVGIIGEAPNADLHADGK